jgi:class 3 adenylate cyclase
LASPALPDGVKLEGLGQHRLKDLGPPERIYQLVHSDLPAEFPPLRSLSVLLNNLPQQATSFIGRERDIAELTRLIHSTRLLTLIGAGGVGKTRLALQLGADVLDDFDDGVWLVELAPVSDGSGVELGQFWAKRSSQQPGRADAPRLQTRSWTMYWPTLHRHDSESEPLVS